MNPKRALVTEGIRVRSQVGRAWYLSKWQLSAAGFPYAPT